MLLENSDIALAIYVASIVISLIICYVFGSKMIEKTGLFGIQTIIASTLNFLLGICAIVGWFFFSWRINEFMFFGGLLLGVGLLIISEAILIIVLFIRRKKMLQTYNSNVGTNS
ncbi:MAG TPA: hypothetical protein GX497_15945 [Bacillus bacterium]|nr:hypothetical protein [Bacillus sp. (in: firmicutes)]